MQILCYHVNGSSQGGTCSINPTSYPAVFPPTDQGPASGWNAGLNIDGNVKFNITPALPVQAWVDIQAVNFDGQILASYSGWIPAGGTSPVVTCSQATVTGSGKNYSYQGTISFDIPNSRIMILGMSSLIVATGITLPYDNIVAGPQTLNTTVSWIDGSQKLSVKVDGVVITSPEGVSAYPISLSLPAGGQTTIEISRVTGTEYAKELYLGFGSAKHKNSFIRVNIPDKIEGNTAYLWPESGSLQLAMPERGVPLDQWVTSNMLGTDGNIPPGEYTVQVKNNNGLWTDMCSFDADGNVKQLISTTGATALGLLDPVTGELQKFREVRVRYNSDVMPDDPAPVDPDYEEPDDGMSDYSSEDDDLTPGDWEGYSPEETTPVEPDDQTLPEPDHDGTTRPPADPNCVCGPFYADIAQVLQTGANNIVAAINQHAQFVGKTIQVQLDAHRQEMRNMIIELNKSIIKVTEVIDLAQENTTSALDSIEYEVHMFADDFYGFREDFYELLDDILFEINWQSDMQEKIADAVDNPLGLIRQEINGNDDSALSIYTKAIKEE